MFSKTVLYPGADGGCNLIEAPFTWQQGDPLPDFTYQRHFDTAEAAMREMADDGRQTSRYHVPKPGSVEDAAIDAPPHT